MTPLQIAIFWLMVAAVLTAGWFSQWGKWASTAIFFQAEAEGTSPLHVVAETYANMLILAAPLAIIFLVSR